MRAFYTNEIEVVSNAGTQGTRERRLFFTHAWYIILPKTITITEAHIAPYGEAQKKFSKELAHFVSAVPSETICEIHAPA